MRENVAPKHEHQPANREITNLYLRYRITMPLTFFFTLTAGQYGSIGVILIPFHSSSLLGYWQACCDALLYDVMTIHARRS